MQPKSVKRVCRSRPQSVRSCTMTHAVLQSQGLRPIPSTAVLVPVRDFVALHKVSNV